MRPPPEATLVPYTTLFRSPAPELGRLREFLAWLVRSGEPVYAEVIERVVDVDRARSEEHSLNSSHPSSSYAVFCLKKKTVVRLLERPIGRNLKKSNRVLLV